MKPTLHLKKFNLITTKFKINSCLYFLLLVGETTFAQGGKDLILTTDYQMIEANIILLGDTRVQYKFSGEERINEMSVDNIIKIKFSDGKEQVFRTEDKNQPASKNNSEELIIELPPYDKDLIAVIPFNFYDEMTGRSIGKKGLEVQRYIERKLTNQTGRKVLDSRETNARLKAANVDYTNLEFYPISELSEYVGAGTLITGSVRFIFEEHVFADNYYVQNDTRLVVDESIGIDQYGRVYEKTDIYEVSTGGNWYVDLNKYKTFETRTALQIFEEGIKIYDEERDPAFQWGSQDDWEGNIQWLLMKSPYRLHRND